MRRTPTPTVPVGLINGMSATRRVRPARVAEIILGYLEDTHDDLKVWVVVEAYKVRVADVIAKRFPDHQVRQDGPLGSPASAIAVIAAPGVNLAGFRLVTGTEGQNEPGWRQDIRDRPIALWTANGLPMAGVHAPPGRMPRLRATYIRRVERVTRGRVVVGDWNVLRRALRRIFRQASIASLGTRRGQVLHIVARVPWRIDRTRTTPGRSMRGRPDHDALQGTVTHR